jgi:hypothetical protein
MEQLIQTLIAEERRVGDASAQDGRAGFRVCEKLRPPLATLAGVAGYRSLLLRALVLARMEVPPLAGVQIKPDGTFHYSRDFEAQWAAPEAARAGRVLARQLLELLAVFIGETLTFRLVRDVWPGTVNENRQSKGIKNEKQIHPPRASARGRAAAKG